MWVVLGGFGPGQCQILLCMPFCEDCLPCLFVVLILWCYAGAVFLWSLGDEWALYSFYEVFSSEEIDQLWE